MLEPLKRVGDEVGRMVSFLLKVSGEPVKRSGTLKGTRSPPHAVDERGALNSISSSFLTIKEKMINI